jgi:hypothetical protein
MGKLFKAKSSRETLTIFGCRYGCCGAGFPFLPYITLSRARILIFVRFTYTLQLYAMPPQELMIKPDGTAHEVPALRLTALHRRNASARKTRASKRVYTADQRARAAARASKRVYTADQRERKNAAERKSRASKRVYTADQRERKNAAARKSRATNTRVRGQSRSSAGKKRVQTGNFVNLVNIASALYRLLPTRIPAQGFGVAGWL